MSKLEMMKDRDLLAIPFQHLFRNHNYGGACKKQVKFSTNSLRTKRKYTRCIKKKPRRSIQKKSKEEQGNTHHTLQKNPD